MVINKKLVSNVFNLLISNMIALLISVLSAFITPLVLGHEQYGYYKIFSLYITYVPLLHMGFIDGILALNAGKSIKDISYSQFRCYTRFFSLLELILSCLMLAFSFIVTTNGYNREILISLAIYSFVFNMSTYFQFFAKCVMDFDKFAVLTRLQSYINLFYLILAFVIYKFVPLKLGVSYFLISMNLTVAIILLCYVHSYKKIVFGKSSSLKKEKTSIFNIFKVGFAITMSYQVTMFMVNADNQFISTFFSVSRYAEYAFAYSMAALLITVFQAVSAVILPYMKKVGKDIVLEKYSTNLSIICILVFFILISYYPIIIIVHNFLPNYSDSIQYFKIVFPGVGITCIIQSYLFNNYILFSKIKDFCLISVINLIIDIIVYYVFYLLFDSTFIIALISIPLLLLWYFSLEWYMHKIKGIKFLSNFMYICILSTVFVLFNQIYSNMWLSLVSYLSYFIILTYLFFNKLIKKIIKKR